MTRRTLPTDQPQQPKAPESAVAKCSAHDCPLPGTIRTEDGVTVCACHYGANRAGWPKATAITIKHAALWSMAREAQCAGAPDSCSANLAKDLLDIARYDGFEIPEVLKIPYRKAGMKLRFAGSIVEAAIRQKAIDDSNTVAAPVSAYGETSPLAMKIAGVANNIRMQAESARRVA